MYPLNTDQPWPYNQWYIAAFAEEVNREILGRTILGKKVVVFRDESGTAHALSGLCPHRMMPMELGTLVKDTIVCGYHGLTYDLSGKCVATPTASKMANCSLRRFPLRELGPLLWIWPGDPERADDTPLPDQASIGIGAEGYRTDCVQRITLKARSQLLIDNLFDLSHLGFIHASILGSGGIALVDPEVAERDGRLLVSRTMRNVPTDDYHRYVYPGIEAKMSVALETDLVGVGLINAGSPVWNGEPGESTLLGQTNFIHGITPEFLHTTHYYSILTRDHRHDDPAFSAALIAQNKAVIQQDVEALEQIEYAISSGIELPREISIASDLGGMRARRYLIKAIQEEQA